MGGGVAACVHLERRDAAEWKEVSTLYDLDASREAMVCAPWVSVEVPFLPRRC